MSIYKLSNSSLIRPKNEEYEFIPYPDGFTWGVGISALQTEGEHNGDGKGPSIWDQFPSHKIKDLSNADTACNFYHNYKSDIQLIKWLGVKNFKTSISWSRVLPNGFGTVNSKGLDFYDRLTDHLLESGIEPWYVLYHWDLPQALQDKGGWVNRDTVYHYLDFLETCYHRLGDRVTNWISFNEPFVFIGAGYFLGIHAPGKTGLKQFLPSVHHVNLANGLGVNKLQSLGAKHVGTSLSFVSVHALDSKPENIQAKDRIDALANQLFLKPIIGDGYPIETLPFLRKLNSIIKSDDMSAMTCNPDFLGVQVYTREVVKHNALMPYIKAKIVSAQKRGKPTTSLGQEVYPEAVVEIADHVLELTKHRNLPLYLTECGISQPELYRKHPVADSYRIKYYHNVLTSLQKHIEDNRIQGMFFWSLMDNFEWAEGYTAPFGLFHVDFNSQERNPKKSAFWIKELIQSH